MLPRRFCFLPGRAPAAVGDGIAIDFLQEGSPAIGDAAVQDAHVTSLADGGAGWPVAVGGENRELPQPRRRRLGGGFGDRGEGAGTTGEGHLCELSDARRSGG